jgi:DNA-binding NarL/FixJ family response regulator
MIGKDFDIVAALPDGESALKKALELKPDLLILDISMGRMSGLEVAHILRERGLTSRLMFLTIHQESDFVEAAWASGATGYVVKSHLTSDLIPAVSAVMEGDLFMSPCLAQSDNLTN